MRDIQLGDYIYILLAVRWTVALFLAGFAGGLVGGTILALARVSKYRIVGAIVDGYVWFFQGTPLLIQIMVVFFAPSILLGYSISSWWAAVFALALCATAFVGEILGGAIESVARGQKEASAALGLGYVDRMRYVVMPQALKIALPSLVGFSVQLIKATSLTSVIGFVEVTKAGQNVNATTFEPLIIFPLIALIYFCICWPVSILGARLEARIRN